ncbi:MAG: carboxymuconolactone decarboxylase family protein [Dehalococcoidia bacterium]|jgi:AhpD family alkylhydroperoxidase|nr:carboxymuconolactone decarboxylase family protein [Dehalococcoidia bacterium]
MDKQMELNQERLRLIGKFKDVLPETIAAELKVGEKAYADGALSAKQKRLIALGVALGRGCTNCILGQSMRALEAGATAQEILEVTGVAVAIGGTMGMAESLRVVKLLEELGKI